MIRRPHPGGDLGARVEAELIQDVDGALGDEQVDANLFFAHAFGDQSRDVGFTLREWRSDLVYNFFAAFQLIDYWIHAWDIKAPSIIC